MLAPLLCDRNLGDLDDSPDDVENRWNQDAEQQQQEMDRRIDQQEQRRREREAQVADQGADQGASRFGSLSPAQRDAMRKKRLDMTTPELRAKFEVVREMYRKRREQRGLNPGEGGFLR